jgi:dTDP-L-rhamnose 4-epimerase
MVTRVRALVTGGAGFIGSHVVEALSTDGHQPVLIAATSSDAPGGPAPRTTGCVASR